MAIFQMAGSNANEVQIALQDRMKELENRSRQEWIMKFLMRRKKHWISR
jgi:hypothetical protein